jgi:ZIP family zinc transporter
MLATGLGAVPFYFLPSLSEAWARRGYAFAGGVMLSASVFDLVLPALELGGYGRCAIGIGLGAALFFASELLLRRRDFSIGELRGAPARRTLLILGTLFVHSMPEGISVGVGYGAGDIDPQLGPLLAVAISLQNIPEGLAVALPLRAANVSTTRCIFWAIFSSLPQPIAAVPALIAVSFFHQLLPYALAFAAGAMGSLVVTELIPESIDGGSRVESGGVFVGGFLLMMVIHAVVS